MKHLFRPLILLAAALKLSACATTFSSQVSVFQEWPANQGKSYIVERAPAQENNPEYKFYEEELRRQLDAKGFQPVATGAIPQVKVSIVYGSNLSEVQFTGFGHPALYDPFWNLHFRRGYFYRPYYFASDPYFPLRASDLNLRRYYLHQLEINITDAVTNKKLADIRASSEQLSPQISLYMPDLIEAALLGFPQKNGSTTQVELPSKK